ncbi:alpha-E domain-containing protein [uncultured Jatrophihabitans sp.]|uniref:alpha-E domain-containing protein n=1 Tax=uncultured Jatrophihabitans sp. TaxID=1610747 RepID=UPI0035CC9D6B
MLSRIAESLYWIGRYVERSEATSRMVDVHLTLLLDDPWAAEDVVCASLLAAMGHAEAETEAVRRDEVLEALVWDPTTPASVLGSLSSARDNARRCREVVSSELWESVNVTWHEANRLDHRAYPHAFLKWVRERAAAFTGTADSTLSRDEAFHFLVLGRSIERADMTARLAAARALAGDAGPSWVTLLQSCGAYQAFLRSARGAVDERRSAEFLLLDPLFPRSLMSALVVAERCLDDLAIRHGSAERGRALQAQRVLGMIRSELEFAPPAELLEDVYQVMERVQSACSVASDAIAQRYFPQGVVTSWIAS